ncbi:arginase family protein [Daldinia caldariorum]|uniref:arginase family protein n=1 Tax=Daldinia caldariorum TaxID=326644 RepID=UPI0020085D77|nr:arginase family protein [Daldinia caldariorum]KAI1464079.1 arginase family protein [Daldinia caldariorum]
MKYLWHHVLLFSGTSLGAWQFPQQHMSPPGYKPLTGVDDDVDIITGSQFNGLTTYANLPYLNCLSDDEVEGKKYDIAILGAPFDTGVTARPGARYGPRGIRAGSQRIAADTAWSVYTGICILKECLTWPINDALGKNPLISWATIVDCGDVPLPWLDNNVALSKLDKAHKVVSGRKASNESYSSHPRIITLGGDHTTTLSALRSTYQRWGQVSVVHFDSHIDTWDPAVLGGGISDYAGLNHGTFLHIAHEEGLIRNTSIHAGIRGPLARRKGDMKNDVRCGFSTVRARDVDKIGTTGVISQIKERVGDSKVYISVDIDVLDPAFAPATGTPEPGGWSSRELLTILDGLNGLDIIGGDVVEVAPIYDTVGQTTALAAAEIAFSLLELMVENPVKS